MPRYSRKKSGTNVYHVILRGINKQDIFLDTQDYQKFLKELKITKEKYNYEIYAYVLMTNHVHLIIYTPDNTISTSIQSLAIRYSLYFNKKYQRCGHLFQNRFLSKNVENTAYLLTLQRYIHQNPVKSKIAKLEEYRWSSYQEYVNKSKLVNTEFILSLFSKNRLSAVELFKKFNNEIIEKDKLEYELKNKYTDEELIEILKHELNEENLINIQNYNKKIIKELVLQALKIEGTNANQISRILSLNKRTVQRIAKANMCHKGDKVSP